MLHQTCYNICQTYLWFYCSVNVPVSGTWLQYQAFRILFCRCFVLIYQNTGILSSFVFITKKTTVDLIFFLLFFIIKERELLLWQWMVVLCDDLPSNGADIYSYRGISVVGHRQTFCKECWHRICDIVIVQCLWYQDGVEYKIYISGFSSLKHS